MKRLYQLLTITLALTGTLFMQDCYAEPITFGQAFEKRFGINPFVSTIREKIGSNLLVIELDNGMKAAEFLTTVKNFEPKQELKNAYNAQLESSLNPNEASQTATTELGLMKHPFNVITGASDRAYVSRSSEWQFQPSEIYLMVWAARQFFITFSDAQKKIFITITKNKITFTSQIPNDGLVYAMWGSAAVVIIGTLLFIHYGCNP